MHKFKLIIYYLFIQKLPHSRLWGGFNTLRIWYMSKVLKIMPFDRNSKFENGVYISDAKQLRIGNYVRINENSFLRGAITIGDYCMIAPNVSIYTRTHVYDNPDIPVVLSGEIDFKEVILEEDVWIGRNVVILPGIHIGKGSIIGANSVVTKNIEPYSIVGGVPAKLIRKRK